MINRYLGNKQSILEPILFEVSKICEPGDWVCDIFSGTLAVSMAFKKEGYNVISNDINKFSHSFGIAYLENNSIPEIDLDSLKINELDNSKGVDYDLSILKASEGFKFLNDSGHYKAYRKLAILCRYLSNISGNKHLPKEYNNKYFFNSYTEAGKNSDFKSVRGTIGRRKFFTPENGEKLDLILNEIKFWFDNKLLSNSLYNLLTSILAESVEKISNTQGTFHDFQRELYDSRSLKQLYMRLPAFDDVIVTNNSHILGKERDSLDFIKDVHCHKLLYIDPPYNFRQYTSYYFMLNLICNYCEIECLKEYFKEIEFVRGQNMKNDFKSTFCQKSLFVESINNLISNAKTKYVLMSYFDGRNHSIEKVPKGEINSIETLIELFRSELFETGSFKLIPIKRLNYQSFNGHKARELNEYLFLAKKAKYDLV